MSYVYVLFDGGLSVFFVCVYTCTCLVHVCKRVCIRTVVGSLFLFPVTHYFVVLLCACCLFRLLKVFSRSVCLSLFLSLFLKSLLYLGISVFHYFFPCLWLSLLIYIFRYFFCLCVAIRSCIFHFVRYVLIISPVLPLLLCQYFFLSFFFLSFFLSFCLSFLLSFSLFVA